MSLSTPSKWQLGLHSSLLQPTLDLRSHRSLLYVAGKQHGRAPSPQKLQYQGSGGRESCQVSLKEACERGRLGREASHLSSNYEVRAPKGLQGGKSGVHLVNTRYVPGDVLGIVHNQLYSIPGESPLSPAISTMESSSQKNRWEGATVQGKEGLVRYSGCPAIAPEPMHCSGRRWRPGPSRTLAVPAMGGAGRGHRLHGLIISELTCFSPASQTDN